MSAIDRLRRSTSRDLTNRSLRNSRIQLPESISGWNFLCEFADSRKWSSLSVETPEWGWKRENPFPLAEPPDFPLDEGKLHRSKINEPGHSGSQRITRQKGLL